MTIQERRTQHNLYYAENREEGKERSRHYYAEHKEETCAKKKEYYILHREERTDYFVAYRPLHREPHNAYMKQWNARNPIKFHGYMRKHNAKHRRLGFNQLNSWFVGCEAHHINPLDVINMPKKLHKSIYHNQTTGQGMVEMNMLAGAFLTEDWT